MSTETVTHRPEQHPGDAFFEKLGLPEEFGTAIITYHGRQIECRDYFLQPDVDPMARQAYDALSAMDPNDKDFPRYRDAFVAASAQFLQGQ